MARSRLAAVLLACACLVAPLGLIAQPVGATTNPTGTITEFSSGLTASSNPGPGMTTGPDGNLWFVENAGNRIGRITPTGTITEFPIPSADTHPQGIVTGSDDTCGSPRAR